MRHHPVFFVSVHFSPIPWEILSNDIQACFVSISHLSFLVMKIVHTLSLHAVLPKKTGDVSHLNRLDKPATLHSCTVREKNCETIFKKDEMLSFQAVCFLKVPSKCLRLSRGFKRQWKPGEVLMSKASSQSELCTQWTTIRCFNIRNHLAYWTCTNTRA